MKTNTNKVGQCFLILLVTFSTFLSASEKLPENNLTILKKLASIVANQVLNDVQLDSNESIIINSSEQNQAGNWIIVNAFVQHLLKQKKSVQLDVQIDSRDQVIVEFQISQLNVKYNSTNQKGVIGREIAIDVDVRVKRDLVNQVLFFKNFYEHYTDSLQTDQAKSFENSNYPFTQADIPEQNSFKKYIQPFVILTITGTVIYSFFVFRSK